MADISKIILPNGAKYNLKDDTGTYIKKAGDKIVADAITTVDTQGTVVKVSPTSLYQSPVPKYLWHDIWAFCRVTTPTYYRSTDGTTWEESDLNKNVFSQKEAWGSTVIINETYKASRWIWLNGGFGYSSLTWLVIGVTYQATVAKFDVLLECSSGSTDEDTWTRICNVQGISVNQQPVWIKTNTNSQYGNLRLTISRNSSSADNTRLSISALKCLSYRWGDQGRGSEYENPYDWDADGNIYPIAHNSKNLGGTSKYWANGYFTNINGVAVGSSPKFTDTTYSVATTSANGLMSSGDKTKLNGISSSYDSATETLTINL